MFIRIEFSSGIPLTRQIMDQIRAQCAGGLLAPGDRLPSIRELAQQLAVNQNTVLRAYERLAAEGLLERRQGDGTYVGEAVRRKPLREERIRFRHEMKRLAHQGRLLGFSGEEMERMIKRRNPHGRKARSPEGES